MLTSSILELLQLLNLLLNCFAGAVCASETLMRLMSVPAYRVYTLVAAEPSSGGMTIPDLFLQFQNSGFESF